MKAFKTLLLLLALGLSVYGQAVNVTANKLKGSATAPSGACSAQQVQLTTAGVVYVCASGTWTSSGGGTTINSTNGQVPYRVNSTTFGDSAFASNALNSTYLSATSGASGAGLTLAVAGGGTNESLAAALKGTGQLVLSNSGYNASAPLLVRSGSLNGGIDFSSGGIFFITSGTAQASVSTSGLIIKSSIQYGHTSGNADAGAIDTGWARFAAGVHRATNGSTGAGQLLVGTSTDTADAQLSVYSQSTTRPGLKLRALSGTSSSQNAFESYNASGSTTFSITSGGSVQIAGNLTVMSFGPFLDGSGSVGRVRGQNGGGLYLGSAAGASTDNVLDVYFQATGTLNWANDLILVRDAANWLAQRNGTNAQTFSVYGTYTNASNFRQIYLQTDATGEGYLYTYGLGTGASAGALNLGTVNTKRWSISTSGHFLAATDNAYDIGAVGTTRPRTGFFGTSLIAPQVYAGVSGNAIAFIAGVTDGVGTLSNAAGTDFGRLRFGGTSASFPALKRSSTELQVVLADDTGFAATQSLYIRYGSGTPEGAVTAPVGAIYSRTDGGAGTSFYVKESGTGNTGWVAK